ncbi:MAG: site-specific DNA-methyltransferase [Desulfatiglandales bacterium]
MKRTNRFICGDALAELRNMPAGSIDMCLTSPPYWGLRDYGIEQIFGGDKDCEHEWGECNKSSQRLRDPKTSVPELSNPKMGDICLKCQAWKGQLGLEPTPEFYIEHLTEIFNEVKRVLKREGTLWLNIGDTYGGSSGGYYPHENELGASKSNIKFKGINKPKCLLMIPERLAIALIEGIENPFNLIGGGWILRNKIIWHKPNAMPSSVTDRFSNRWEYLFMFSKSQRYYFDLDGVREPYTEPMNRWGGDNLVAKGKSTWDKGTGQETYRDRNMRPNPDGKNPGDVFEINTQPFPEAHFAVFPEKLCEKPIKAGCPKQICKKCGKTRERITEKGEFIQTGGKKKKEYTALSESQKNIAAGFHPSVTIGFTSCKCNADFEPGIVLDPFAGAGTVGVVAKSLGRRFILIDIKKEYMKMAKKRVAQVGHQKELFE